MYLEKTVFKEDRISKTNVLHDYYLGWLSRNISVLGRKEVHIGRAHFGIFGDGKELAQLVMAKYLRKGDWRAGYYRDQTLMMALNLVEPEELFAQIYGETNPVFNPSTSGRNFNNHFSTPTVDEQGKWLNHSEYINSSSDISPTGGQMPRLLGLAWASKLVKTDRDLAKELAGRVGSDEIALGSIGDASTSEGMFFETINAAAVMQVPMALMVYDDGYGISVPVEKQTAKGSISEALKGFEKVNREDKGIYIYRVKGWDYNALHDTFRKGIKQCREEQAPVLFHIQEMTQPLGHSTSGSHERYKSKQRLEWEKQFDPLNQFKNWILNQGMADLDELNELEKKANKQSQEIRKNAWRNYKTGFKKDIEQLQGIFMSIRKSNAKYSSFLDDFDAVNNRVLITRARFIELAKRTLRRISVDDGLKNERQLLVNWIDNLEQKGIKLYSSRLYRENTNSVLNVNETLPIYAEEPKFVNGQELLNENFQVLFEKDPLLVTFGEDTGKLGGVNQTMKGMQERFGESRISDTGIRETTIIGQGVGLALRGLKPIAEIQYLDYLIYALSTLSDDVATTSYRTNGKQVAPLIVRTRGHQLQGIWHAGSPMVMLLGALQGMYLCVPRNMTRAAGYYNLLVQGKDPALVIEPLKGYSVKEPLPENLGDFHFPLGVPEIINEGADLTMVSYGYMSIRAQKAVDELKKWNIHVDLVDLGTLIPFDLESVIVKSLKKTNKLMIVDEDIPGGASAYILQKILEEQKGFYYLDAPPVTLTAVNNRPAYGIDGEFFTKPNVEGIVDKVLDMMHEYDRNKYPNFYNV